MEKNAWVSFCIGTYKRPQLLAAQLTLLLQQRFPHFEIVISDNDPEASAENIASSFGDPRIRYFKNDVNLGMVRSFNKSIERAETDYIVMVTDDDPVETMFLQDMYAIHARYPGYSMYCGFMRKHSRGTPEIIPKEKFIAEILDTDKTLSILWSSCVIQKEAALKIGQIPEYGSPHLADHAFIAMAGSVGGGVIVNRMYSSLTSHNANFSKSNFDTYFSGCKGFFETLEKFVSGKPYERASKYAVNKHLGVWFIGSVFLLKRYYTLSSYNRVRLNEIDEFATGILQLPFMKKFAMKFYAKRFIFSVKRRFRLLT